MTAGGDVGPDLTGSDRANADYILENVLDPSAAVSRDYTVTNLAMSDGRLIAGIIREQNDASLVIQTANERIVVPREDIEAIKPSIGVDDAGGTARDALKPGNSRLVCLSRVEQPGARSGCQSEMTTAVCLACDGDSMKLVTASLSDQAAERADDVGVFRPVAGGDADELAGFEAFLVVAGSRVDSAADEQAADQVVGVQAGAQLDQGEVGE